MERRPMFVLACFFFCLHPSVAYVQSDDQDNGQVPLRHPTFVEEIVVTGEIVAETAAVSIVTAEEIKAKGARDVAEALEFIPGANIRVGGKGEALIRLRGFRQREIALLMDGVPVYSPYDGQLDLSSLPVDSIERIEVVKGAASVMYGANAMGGVVNIITRKSNGTSRVNLKGEYGSGESGSVEAGWQGGTGPIRYLANGRYFNQENYPLSGDYVAQPNQEGGERANSDRRLWNGKLSLGWDMGERKRMSVNLSHVDQVRGLPHHESDSKAKFLRFTHWRQGILDAIYDAELASSSIKGKVYYEYLDTILDGFDDFHYMTQEGKGSFTETNDNYAVGGDLIHRYRFTPRLLLKSALRFRYDHNELQADIEETWEENGLNTLSIPLEVEWTGAGRFDFTTGTSVDVFSFDRTGAQGRKTSTAFNPQAAAILRANHRLRLKFSAANKTRFPTMKELFTSVSGNPDLEPMRATVLELGGDYTPQPPLLLSVTGFYNNVRDLISRSNNTRPYENIDKAVFSGWEAGVEIRSTGRVAGSVFYTFLNTEAKSSVTQESIEYRPRHKLDANGRFRFPADFKLDLYFSVVSSQVYYENDEERKLAPYAMVDLKCSKTFGQRFEPYLRVRNLFDVAYYESAGFPREGRTIFGGVHIDISE